MHINIALIILAILMVTVIIIELYITEQSWKERKQWEKATINVLAQEENLYKAEEKITVLICETAQEVKDLRARIEAGHNG